MPWSGRRAARRHGVVYYTEDEGGNIEIVNLEGWPPEGRAREDLEEYMAGSRPALTAAVKRYWEVDHD